MKNLTLNTHQYVSKLSAPVYLRLWIRGIFKSYFPFAVDINLNSVITRHITSAKINLTAIKHVFFIILSSVHGQLEFSSVFVWVK